MIALPLVRPDYPCPAPLDTRLRGYDGGCEGMNPLRLASLVASPLLLRKKGEDIPLAPLRFAKGG